jgi:hypothetical protein
MHTPPERIAQKIGNWIRLSRQGERLAGDGATSVTTWSHWKKEVHAWPVGAKPNSVTPVVEYGMPTLDALMTAIETKRWSGGKEKNTFNL